MTLSKKEMADGHDPNDLAAFAEGRLEAGARARMIAHVAECRDCRQTLAELLRAGSAAQAGRSVLARPRVWMPVAASVAILATGVLLVTHSRTPSRVEQPPAPARVAPGDPPAPSAQPPAGAVAPPTPSNPAAGNAAPPSDAGDLLRRRGGERHVAGKTFRLVAGEWIDTAYDPLALLPAVDIRSASQRREVLERIPALQPFASLGTRVTVVLDGTVYRFNIADR